MNVPVEDSLPTFIAGSFSDMAGLPESEKMWRYLNHRDHKIRMKTASDLGRPALEALSSAILNDFPEVFGVPYSRLDRFKQMTGVMTRQVMEGEGYIWLRNGVPMSGAPFSSASKYRSRDEVDFHAWRLSSNTRHVGITLDRPGAELPVIEGSKWVFWKSVSGTMSERALHLAVAIGVTNLREALQALNEHGFYTQLTQRVMRAP